MRTVTAVVKVKVDESLINELETDGIEVTDHVTSIIQDHLADRGYIVKADSYDADLFAVLCEYAVININQQAIEDLEKEILDSKMCVNGNCDD
jgi:hypothetical protein